MPAFPVDLRVAGRRALVVGGGKVAARRVESLVAGGAEVTVVAPELGTRLRQRLDSGDFTWWRRDFGAGDCAGMDLVLAAVDDPEVGPAVHDDARAHGALVSVADVPHLSDFYFGAVARRGSVAVSVHTDGTAPGMAVRLRDEIAPLLDERALARTERFAELRRRLRELDDAPEHAARRAAFLARFTDDDALDALRTPHAIERALASYPERPAPEFRPADEGMRPGSIAIVGAGPGDPELLTLRGARLLRAADDIVVDALVAPEIYADCSARVIWVGKRAAQARVTQDEIHRILIDLVTAGRRVVRLKGGDPGLFGRLDDELTALAALAKRGIEVEIVPGVTSALAAPAAAGIAVTARGVADRVTVLTGHRRADAPAELHDPPAYRPDQTLVILMALNTLEPWVEALVAAGYPRDVPAVMISRATRPDEAWVAAPLTELPEAVRAVALPAPATLLVGWVADATVSRARPGRG